MFAARGTGKINWKEALLAVAFLTAVVMFFFWRSFQAPQVLFSNDGPFGQIAAHVNYEGTALTGYWMDYHWLGMEMPSASVNVTQLIYHLIGHPIYGVQGAVNFMKFYGPLSLILLGFSAWFFWPDAGRKWLF